MTNRFLSTKRKVVMPEKMRVVFVQEYNKNVPFHKETLEGTKEFPIYQIGWANNYSGVFPISLETMSFGKNEDGSYSSTFAHVMCSPKYKNKLYSIYFPPHPEDGIFEVHLLRKCRFVREVEKEKIYANGVSVESLIMSIPDLGKYTSSPVRVAFDMFWKVVDEN